ncbi:MAG: HPP family protein [Magnetococcales bacterium]|nr:HPP family protein [Magnetococcales bacterium]
MNWLNKMSGGASVPPRLPLIELFWSGLGAFCGIGLVSYLHYRWLVPHDLALVIGSFGASAVLLYGVWGSPLAQPRNLMGGHILSGIIGVAMYQLLGGIPWLAAALAVALSVVAMQWTRTVHPPGGATALIAVIGSDQLHALGYGYALMPAGLGPLLMLLVALIVNNLAPSRRYPEYWW